MLRDNIFAAIRTGVAFIVTWLLATLVGLGVELDTDTEAALSVVAFGVAMASYNFIAGLLERKVHPYFGILLGIPKAPQYGSVGTATPSAANGTVVPEAPKGQVV